MSDNYRCATDEEAAATTTAMNGACCCICLQEGERNLIKVCLCASLVHQACLGKWLEISGCETCRICKVKYDGIRYRKVYGSFRDWLCHDCLGRPSAFPSASAAAADDAISPSQLKVWLVCGLLIYGGLSFLLCFALLNFFLTDNDFFKSILIRFISLLVSVLMFLVASSLVIVVLRFCLWRHHSYRIVVHYDSCLILPTTNGAPHNYGAISRQSSNP